MASSLIPRQPMTAPARSQTQINTLSRPIRRKNSSGIRSSKISIRILSNITSKISSVDHLTFFGLALLRQPVNELVPTTRQLYRT
jgi:hypothetical protein